MALRTTLIVGHPGEGPEEFAELLEFVREARFERLGAFMYSEEEGTYGAAHFPDEVPKDEKQRRLDTLMELQGGISLGFNLTRVGSEQTVLIDGALDDSTLTARSSIESPDVDGEILVKVKDSSLYAPGTFLKVRITGADMYDLTAEPSV